MKSLMMVVALLKACDGIIFYIIREMTSMCVVMMTIDTDDDICLPNELLLCVF